MGAPNRIGVLGGTFDPIHIAHLVVASVALHDARLDEVHLVVANDPRQKTLLRPVSPAEVRFQAVQAAVENLDGLFAADLEIARGGPSYMVDTFESLAVEHPGSELFLIGGLDSVATLDTWHRASDLAQLAEVLVVDRPGAHPAQLAPQWRVTQLEMPLLDISSTNLKARMARGLTVNFLVPRESLVVYRSAGLYP